MAAEETSLEPASAQRRPARAKPPGHGRFARPLLATSARTLLRAASWLPFPALWRIGGWIGGLGVRVPNRSRNATRVNLKLCLPELGEPERARLERESLKQAGRAMLELGALWNWKRERVLGLVREVRGREHLDAALAQGRGVIGLTPHLGAWEITGLFAGAHYPFTALYRPPRALEMESVYRGARERFGTRMAPADANGVRAIYRALAAGELCGILPDQDPGRGAGMFVPFFGITANTTVFVARLVHKFGSPVVFCWAERLPRGAGFRLHFEPASSELANPDVELATRALNREIERLVRACPEQYLWSYMRFRTRPDGERGVYRRRASDEA